ncbi:YopT-type cysteine protease domain-containing protein [Aquincola sp. MAHUQ-54]|uniref:YopT-type cysteine protease domain-containing protein n=1 Tax=Aquincola agrisoli TaxID=3119538 RepID=A0AAW9QF75_9BURK
MPERAEVIQRLSALAVRQVDNFNQSDEHRAWQAGVAMAQGYCHGICLDWVRRVLQGGRAAYGPNPARQNDAGYDFNARRQNQARRQGNAWNQFYAIREDVRRVNNANYTSARSDYESRFNDLSDLIRQLIPLYNDNADLGDSKQVTLPGTLGTRLRARYSWTGPAGQAQVGLLEQIITDLQAERSALQAPQRTPAAAQDQRTWQRFTQRMDQAYGKRRAFQNIDLVHLNPTTRFNTLDDVVASVTDPAMNAYANGMAMVIGIDMRTTDGDSGHAVAMHWSGNNQHVFLDPNYGMFEFDSLHQGRSVRSALRYLFAQVYPTYRSVRAVLNQVEYSTYRRAA